MLLTGIIPFSFTAQKTFCWKDLLKLNLCTNFINTDKIYLSVHQSNAKEAEREISIKDNFLYRL